MPKKRKIRDSWQDEAWEILLRKIWDKKDPRLTSVEYTKADLHPILRKYVQSGQGEIRIFHSGANVRFPLRSRNISKIPISRERWRLVRRAAPIIFPEPIQGGIFEAESKLTEGMIAGIKETLNKNSNPGETTLLAIANYVGLIANFYNLDGRGILFTGGRQKAGTKIKIDKEIDISKAQIEIDGGFEWEQDIVIAEVKSKFKQPDFDVNQALLPTLKWKNLVKNKRVHALVLLAETSNQGLEYWAYDLKVKEDSEVPEMYISKSRRYIVKVSDK